jgi:hypothetical protein
MLPLIFGIFLILHGFVHLLYAGQSQRLFELRPNLTWPDGSWLFARILGDKAVRRLATIAMLLTALGLAAAGLGLLFSLGWWRPLTVGSAVFSTAIFICCWDGNRQRLDEKGGVGVLINLLVMVVVLARFTAP